MLFVDCCVSLVVSGLSFVGLIVVHSVSFVVCCVLFLVCVISLFDICCPLFIVGCSWLGWLLLIVRSVLLVDC